MTKLFSSVRHHFLSFGPQELRWETTKYKRIKIICYGLEGGLGVMALRNSFIFFINKYEEVATKESAIRERNINIKKMQSS